MTTETRIMIELGDIKAIEFECKKCHARITRLLDNWLQHPLTCSNCGEQWMLRENLEKIREFVAYIGQFANSEVRPFILRFDVTPGNSQ